jgi:hypothetical protein
LRYALIRHLRANKGAGDTVRGILDKWLPERGFEDAPEHIRAVLAELVAADYLRPKNLPDGETFYARGDAPDLQLKGDRP